MADGRLGGGNRGWCSNALAPSIFMNGTRTKRSRKIQGWPPTLSDSGNKSGAQQGWGSRTGHRCRPASKWVDPDRIRGRESGPGTAVPAKHGHVWRRPALLRRISTASVPIPTSRLAIAVGDEASIYKTPQIAQIRRPRLVECEAIGAGLHVEHRRVSHPAR